MSERRVDVSTAPMDVAARETNRVLRNTYMLLGMTLAFSAMTATISMVLQLPTFMYLVFVLVGFGLLFVVNRMADSAKGLPAIFAFTGVMGAALGPMLNQYLSMGNGPELVLQSLGGTALIFFGLSAYALQSKRDFSFMSGFLFAGLLVAIVAMIGLVGWGIGYVGMRCAPLKDRFYEQLGPIKYAIVMSLFLMLIGVLAKIALRLLFGIKYIVSFPGANFNI